jgi:hypothetical protein
VDHAADRPDSRRVFVAPRDDLPSFSFFLGPTGEPERTQRADRQRRTTFHGVAPSAPTRGLALRACRAPPRCVFRCPRASNRRSSTRCWRACRIVGRSGSTGRCRRRNMRRIIRCGERRGAYAAQAIGLVSGRETRLLGVLQCNIIWYQKTSARPDSRKEPTSYIPLESMLFRTEHFEHYWSDEVDRWMRRASTCLAISRRTGRRGKVRSYTATERRINDPSERLAPLR